MNDLFTPQNQSDFLGISKWGKPKGPQNFAGQNQSVVGMAPYVPMPQTQGMSPMTQINTDSSFMGPMNSGYQSLDLNFNPLAGAWDGLKNIGNGALDAIKGGSLFDKTDGKNMKSMGAANTLLGLFDSLSRYNMGNEQLGLFKDQLATNKQQFALNFGNQAQVLDDRRRALYERDVAQAKLNGRTAPKEFTPLSRG